MPTHLIETDAYQLHQSSQQKDFLKEDMLSSFIHGSRRNFVSRSTTNMHTNIPSSSHPYIFPLYNPASFEIIIFWESITPSISPISTLPSNYLSPSASQTSLTTSQYLPHLLRKPSSGHVTIHGLNLGASHAPLQDVIQGVENVKGKRNMYAETVRENMEMLDAIRGCEWNMEMNPLDISVRGAKDINHDFSAG